MFTSWLRENEVGRSEATNTGERNANEKHKYKKINFGPALFF